MEALNCDCGRLDIMSNASVGVRPWHWALFSSDYWERPVLRGAFIWFDTALRSSGVRSALIKGRRSWAGPTADPPFLPFFSIVPGPHRATFTEELWTDPSETMSRSLLACLP